MAPYEALYGKRCRAPLCWYLDGEVVVLGPKLLKQTTKKKSEEDTRKDEGIVE